MIRPAGIYRFAFTTDMAIASGSFDQWSMPDFESGKVDGYTHEFKDKVDDEDIKKAVINFMAVEGLPELPVLGRIRSDRVMVRWPAGRLENWFVAERVTLALEIETIKQDPKSKGVLEPGTYTIMSEQDHDHLLRFAHVGDPEELWGESLETYNYCRTCDMKRFTVGKNDKLSAKRISQWHHEFIMEYLKYVRVDPQKPFEEIFLLHRPTGFVERRRVTASVQLQIGAAPCKLEDREAPRWPQAEALEIAE